MNRLKLLYIHQILTTETDEQHSITLDELRQRLADKGITAERKALYKDLDALRSFGVHIVSRKAAQTTYYVPSNTWRPDEMELLVNIIQNTEMLTERKRQIIIDKLLKQVSTYEAATIQERLAIAPTAPNAAHRELSATGQALLSSIAGVLVGDALGVPVEFQHRRELQQHPVTAMRAYGTHSQPAGTWSDDGSLTLATLDALTKPFSYANMMHNFIQWLDHNAYTATGVVFDVGFTTDSSIQRGKTAKNIKECGAYEANSNGNGSLMRILPMLFYVRATYGPQFYKQHRAMESIHYVSALTHGHERSRMACGLYLCIANELLEHRLGHREGASLPQLIATGLGNGFHYYQSHDAYASEITHFTRLTDVPAFSALSADAINSGGYVIDTLEASIWSLLTTDNFSTAVLRAINLGRDTDTTGAVTGGLAGLYYGFDEIPEMWLNALPKREEWYQLCVNAMEQLGDKDEQLSLDQAEQSAFIEWINAHPRQTKLLGTAIGNMAGSKYERWAFKSRDFEICGKSSDITGDTVMTLAVADALTRTIAELGYPNDSTADKTMAANASDATTDSGSALAVQFDALLTHHACEMMRHWYAQYPHAIYGTRFREWLKSESAPNDSYGNGAAMRIGAVGFLAKTEEQVRRWSHAITATSHNSPEAIKAAEATALTVFHLRNGLSKAKLRKLIEEQYYALDGLSVEYLHEILKKDDSSQGTMPVAFTVFFESDDFETAIRNAIYIGGDTDTIGAIVGTWAQIIYPIPNDITERVITRLDPKIRQCIYNFDSTVR